MKIAPNSDYNSIENFIFGIKIYPFKFMNESITMHAVCVQRTQYQAINFLAL